MASLPQIPYEGYPLPYLHDLFLPHTDDVNDLFIIFSHLVCILTKTLHPPRLTLFRRDPSKTYIQAIPKVISRTNSPDRIPALRSSLEQFPIQEFLSHIQRHQVIIKMNFWCYTMYLFLCSTHHDLGVSSDFKNAMSVVVRKMCGTRHNEERAQAVDEAVNRRSVYFVNRPAHTDIETNRPRILRDIIHQQGRSTEDFERVWHTVLNPGQYRTEWSREDDRIYNVFLEHFIGYLRFGVYFPGREVDDDYEEDWSGVEIEPYGERIKVNSVSAECVAVPEGETCAICMGSLDEYLLGRCMKLNSCGHMLHWPCLDKLLNEWVKDDYVSCPYCRASICQARPRRVIREGVEEEQERPRGVLTRTALRGVRHCLDWSWKELFERFHAGSDSGFPQEPLWHRV